MSQEPLHVAPLSDDATQDRSVIDNEQASAANRHSSRRPPLRARPQSWHPYGAPVEPPLESTSSRSIGVHSILNPPSQSEQPGSGSREQHSVPAPSSRPRKGSSPAPRSMHPLAQQPMSPRARGRTMMSPGSPSARFVGSGARSGQSSVSQSPLVPHEPPLGIRQTPVSSPMSLDSTLRPITTLPGTQPPISASLQSNPGLHSRQTSSGIAPHATPVTHETSPPATHSPYSPYGHPSPAVPNVSIPPTSTPYPPHTSSPYIKMEPSSRGIPPGVPHHMSEASSGSGPPASSKLTTDPGMIPCFVDLKSGSISQAEKRKANSDASRRFRNRKRNELQLEARITAQQEEIRSLLQQRDHYRSERDFFRDNLGRSMSLSQLPPRPTSPRAAPSTLVLGSPGETTPPPPSGWAEAPRPATSSQSTPSGVPGRPVEPPRSQWPSVPPISRDMAPSGPPSIAGGTLPPFQGPWPRQ